MRDANRPPQPASPDPEVSPWALAGLGVQFAVALVLFGYLGQWVDARLDTAPFALLFGVLAGAGGTFVLSYRRIMAPRTLPPRADPPQDDRQTRGPQP